MSARERLLEEAVEVIDVPAKLEQIEHLMSRGEFNDRILQYLGNFYDVTDAKVPNSVLTPEDIFHFVYGDKQGIHSMATKLGLKDSAKVAFVAEFDEFAEEFLFSSFVKKQSIDKAR